jgi:hypothetical protein
MGGKGSGGLRVGAGRKPKGRAEAWLGGDAGKRGRGKAKPKAAPVTLIAAPRDLPEDQRAVWNELAPHACARRTLTDQTVAAFRDLCEAIVWKRRLFTGIESLTVATPTGIKAHPLIAQHRGMMQRVEAGMLRFCLAPMGKELAPAEAPKDEWSEFDEPTVQ